MDLQNYQMYSFIKVCVIQEKLMNLSFSKALTFLLNTHNY